MTFQALLVCEDEATTAVLKPVLTGFGVGLQSCSYADASTRLTDHKFDAVIVDYDDPGSAASMLHAADQSASGFSVVTIALLSDRSKVRNVFGAGANFVLYKPVSTSEAEASLRAATALIKRERRRSFRVPAQLPVQVKVDGGEDMEAILLDLSEEGMDLLTAQPLYPSAVIRVHFNLPGGNEEFDAKGEIAWANPNGQSGVRLVDLSEELRMQLKNWVAINAPEIPPSDPEPVSHCKLTDLSLGGCYVETESPFPERSGILLTLKVQEMEVHAEGMVRVMHPGFGMGIEFASRTAEQREKVGNFIDLLTSRPGAVPELLITPNALTAANDYTKPENSGGEEMEDALLELLHNHEVLTQEDFLRYLHRQRSSEEVVSS